MLIWIITISFIILAFICVFKGYLGTLPWLTAMVSLPWTAYGVSAGFYYNKSKAEKSQGGRRRKIGCCLGCYRLRREKVRWRLR